MKFSFVKYPSLIVAAGLCLASGAFGAPSTLKLVSGSNDDGGVTVGGGILTSPYSMSLNGTAPVPMFCDDWVDNQNEGQTWDITGGTALSAITGQGTVGAPDNTNVYFGSDSSAKAYDTTDMGSIALTQEVKYVAAVDLAVELSNLPGADAGPRRELSLALWDVFNPNATTDGQNDNTLMDSASKSDLEAAIKFAKAYTGGSIWGYTATVYTPLASSSGYDISPGTETLTGGIAKSGNGGPPQEFIKLTYVPEPATWGVLAFDFIGAGIVGLYFRRRKSRAQS
jgi:hypothetical protein